MDDFPPGPQRLEFEMYCGMGDNNATEEKAIGARQLVAPLGTSEKNAREETAARLDNDFMHDAIRDAIALDAASSASDVPEEEQRSAQTHMEEAIPWAIIQEHGADCPRSYFLRVDTLALWCATARSK
jgi:hypothetical protein